jgi:predicted acetyltransferase
MARLSNSRQTILMTEQANNPLPAINLVRATREQAPIVGNLLELYAHDLSVCAHLDIGEDGRFAYKSLPLYWSEPNRHPFLIRVDGKLAGMALVKRSEVSGDRTVWDMAEFFVLRRYRRLGFGTLAAHEVWKRYPGRWEVRVMQSNLPASLFWERAISDFTGESIRPVDVEIAGRSWQLFSFESG